MFEFVASLKTTQGVKLIRIVRIRYTTKPMSLALISRRAVLCVAARATRRATQERVLRYPDGVERRIIYPVEAEPDSRFDEELDVPWWNAVEVRPAADLFSSTRAVASTSAPTTEEGVFTFDWDKLRQEAEALGQRTQHCFEVHTQGCPWLVDRPVWVLTVNGKADTSAFYTLRTRVLKGQEVTDELAKVLGSASLASRMSVSQLEDGVVAFLSKRDAEQYADALHAERAGRDEVCIMGMGAHELFRFVGQAAGAVVAVRSEAETGWLPEPHQLAGAVRGQAAWDDL